MTACTCNDYDEDCRCQRCRDVAVGAAACAHRLEKLAAGRVRSSYDGMCDRCFTTARDIRACGLRVAEHGPMTGPTDTCAACGTRLDPVLWDVGLHVNCDPPAPAVPQQLTLGAEGGQAR